MQKCSPILLAEMVVWAAVILAASSVLHGTPFAGPVIVILGGGAAASLILLGARRVGKEDLR